MFSTLISVALLSSLAISAARAEFDISATQLTQCDSTHVTWNKTTGPYNLIVVPADDPCSEVLVDLGDHNGTSMTWNAVNLAAGTRVLLSLEDADGDEAWTGNLTVAASNNTSCLPGGAVSSSLVHSSSAASATPVTTLVVNPEVDPTPAVAPPSAAESSASGAQPVGAVNAGSNPSNGAFTMHQLNIPALAISALAVLFAAAL